MTRPKSPRRNSRPRHPSAARHRGGPPRGVSRSAGGVESGCLILLILVAVAIGWFLTQ